MDDNTKLNELRGIIELIQDVIDDTTPDVELLTLTLRDIDRAIEYLNELYKTIKDKK